MLLLMGLGESENSISMDEFRKTHSRLCMILCYLMMVKMPRNFKRTDNLLRLLKRDEHLNLDALKSTIKHGKKVNKLTR